MHNVLVVHITLQPNKLRHILIYVLIYHLTYICPSLFGWKENMIFEKTVTFNLWIFLFSEFEWHQWLKWFAFWQLIQTFRFIKKLIIETKAISDHHDRFFLGANFYQGHQRIQMILKRMITIMINCCAGQIFISCLFFLRPSHLDLFLFQTGSRCHSVRSSHL